MALFDRYTIPLLLLGAFVYVALFPDVSSTDWVSVQQQTHQVIVGSEPAQQHGLRRLHATTIGKNRVDPKSIEDKMSRMQTETTDGNLVHDRSSKENDEVDVVDSHVGDGDDAEKLIQDISPYLTTQQKHSLERLMKPYSPDDAAIIETNKRPVRFLSKEYDPTKATGTTTKINKETTVVSEEDREDVKPKKAFSNHDLEIQRRQKLFYARNKNVLALGGSTTWGSKLDKRELAYPFLLPGILGPTWRIHNLAVRATDASYASQCIESMIREGVESKNDIEFDVILLEYSLNGLDGMPLLLQRLRQRYPKAVIIYVHLWSLRMSVDNAVTGAKPRDELNKGLKFKDADESMNAMLGDPNAKWTWAPKMKQDSLDISAVAQKSMAEVNGHIYKVPMPESPQIAFTEHWFGPDYHHLSARGHSIVANDLAQLLLDESIMGAPITDIHDVGLEISPEDIGTWGAGDHCYSWYETGDHPDVIVDGGTMKMFVKPDKYAVNVGLSFGQPATFTFPNHKEIAQPVMLMIMSWGPGVYPKSKIDLVSPNYKNQTSILDPLHPNPLNHVFHVTRTAHVGWANYGQSSIAVDPIEDMQRPLRIIGIVMCGACVEMDETYLNNDSTHQRLGGTMPRPVEIAPEATTEEDIVSPHENLEELEQISESEGEQDDVDENQSQLNYAGREKQSKQGLHVPKTMKPMEQNKGDDFEDKPAQIRAKEQSNSLHNHEHDSDTSISPKKQVYQISKKPHKVPEQQHGTRGKTGSTHPQNHQQLVTESAYKYSQNDIEPVIPHLALQEEDEESTQRQMQDSRRQATVEVVGSKNHVVKQISFEKLMGQQVGLRSGLYQTN